MACHTTGTLNGNTPFKILNPKDCRTDWEEKIKGRKNGHGSERADRDDGERGEERVRYE